MPELGILVVLFLLLSIGYAKEGAIMALMWREWKLGVLIVLAMTIVVSVEASHAGDDLIRGTVVETMNSGSYTYIYLDRQGSKEWFAVPESLVRCGDEIQLQPGIQMGAYTSPTLGRTFEKIVFSGGVSGVLKRVVTTAEETTDSQAAIKIPKAVGPGAYTVAEIFAKKGDLNGKKIVVRGKVVKTSQFEGLHWLRIVDGSGSSKRGNHKLVVTTKDEVAEDDIVTVKGTIITDKAFGALTYEVVVEEAQVKKEVQ